MKTSVVIGGGVIGLCSAYYLALEGIKVTVIDKGDFSDGCSYGNAGYITPSHFNPLCSPDMVRKGLKWLFNSNSPFYIRPRLSLELLSWGLDFLSHANHHYVLKCRQPLVDLSVFSRTLYGELAEESNGELKINTSGILFLYKDETLAHEENELAHAAKQLGLEVDVLSSTGDIRQIERNIPIDASGGVYYRSDWSLDPSELMAYLKTRLKDMGVRFISNYEVASFAFSGNRLSAVQTKNKESFSADSFVLANGAWLAVLGRRLGERFKILPGKGYSFETTVASNGPSIPTILLDGKVAVSLLENRFRFGGTLEMTNLNDQNIRQSRIKGIRNTIDGFYPGNDFDFSESRIWYGYRPCSSTGMPIIKRSNKYQNVVLAGGHAMAGVSLGPATGAVVRDLLIKKKSDLDTSLFSG